MDPQNLLNRILKSAKREAISNEVMNKTLDTLYRNLYFMLYTRAYVTYVKENASGGESESVQKDLDEVIKVIELLSEMDEVSFIEAFHKYLEEMDIVTPDFTSVRKLAEERDMEKLIDMAKDYTPFAKLKEKGKKVTEKIQDDVQKLLAAAGKYLINKELETDPELLKFVLDMQEKSRSLTAANSYVEYKISTVLKQVMKTHE